MHDARSMLPHASEARAPQWLAIERSAPRRTTRRHDRVIVPVASRQRVGSLPAEQAIAVVASAQVVVAVHAVEPVSSVAAEQITIGPVAVLQNIALGGSLHRQLAGAELAGDLHAVDGPGRVVVAVVIRSRIPRYQVPVAASARHDIVDAVEIVLLVDGERVMGEPAGCGPGHSADQPRPSEAEKARQREAHQGCDAASYAGGDYLIGQIVELAPDNASNLATSVLLTACVCVVMATPS